MRLFEKSFLFAFFVFSWFFLFYTPLSAQELKDAASGGARKKTITVTSDTMDADKNGRLVVFRGNVFAEEEFNLCGDVLSVYYDESNEVKEIVAAGNVRIVDGKRMARGEQAAYDRNRKAVVITGKASAKQCSDIVNGEKITFYLESDRMIIEGEGQGRVRAKILPNKECQEVLEESEEFKCRSAR